MEHPDARLLLLADVHIDAVDCVSKLALLGGRPVAPGTSMCARGKNSLAVAALLTARFLDGFTLRTPACGRARGTIRT